MNFRLNAKNIFLTYPHCNGSKQDLLDFINTKYPNKPFRYVIAQETHQDGSLHLHALICVISGRGVDTRNPNYWDFNGCHGNYKPAANPAGLWDYLHKEDQNPLKNCDHDDLRGAHSLAQKGTRALIGKRLLEDTPLDDVVVEYPQLLFGYKRLKEDLKAFQDGKKVYAEMPGFLPNPWGFLICPASAAKRRHYWIYSRNPNRGKTTWARTLEQYGGYIKSSDFSYWGVCGRETLIIFDDYNTAGLKFNALNQICDGSYEYRVFMGGLLKLNRPLCIVLSNTTIEELYPNMYPLLLARFIVKCID